MSRELSETEMKKMAESLYITAAEGIKDACKDLSLRRMYRCSAAKWRGILKLLKKREFKTANRKAAKLCVFCYNSIGKEDEHHRYLCHVDETICDCTGHDSLVMKSIHYLEEIDDNICSDSVFPHKSERQKLLEQVQTILSALKECAKQYSVNAMIKKLSTEATD